MVEKDPFEKGERKKLNLGHTFGHALELLSNFQISHGESVALGLIAATTLASSMNKCSPTLEKRVANAVAIHELPTTFSGFCCDEVIAAMQHDKKRLGKDPLFVVPTELGTVEIVHHVPESSLRVAISRIIGD